MSDESSRLFFFCFFFKGGGAGVRGILFDKHREAPSFHVWVRWEKTKTVIPVQIAGSVGFSLWFVSSGRTARGIVCELEVWLVSPYHRCRGVSSPEWTPRSRIPLEGGRISHRLAGKTRPSVKRTDTSLLFCKVTAKL